MTTLDLATATIESFTPFIGQTFELVFNDGRLPMTLVETRIGGEGAPGSSRQPFVLTFHGEPRWRFPQQIYRVDHPSLGTMEIFLVQVAADAKVGTLEAVFA